MVALTYGNVATKSATPVAAETQAPRKPFFTRFFEALMEARMIQAQREIRMYTRLVPPIATTDKK